MKSRFHKIGFVAPAVLSAAGVVVFSSCDEEKQGAGQSDDSVPAQSTVSSPLLGGQTTVEETSRKAFTLSARNLSKEHKSSFFVGNSLFNKNWIQAPGSAEARDGLGPLFIARSCSGCHTQDGRGRPPVNGEEYVSLLFRLSSKGKDGLVSPHPLFGDQLQTRSLSKEVEEPEVEVRYESIDGRFADGTPYTLEKPIYGLKGEGSEVLLSPRVAQAVIGLGLLEAIPEQQLKEWADPEDANGDGVSGRLNWVDDVTSGGKAIGRFGWKANQPDIRQQVAAAFLGDLGITSSLFPDENHSAAQHQAGLAKFVSGGSPEIPDRLLDHVVLYCQTIAVPAQRNAIDKDVRAGERLFNQMNCNACHVSNTNTGKHSIAALSNQKIRPFTDLLLHDMGEGLADHRPDFQANGREWRTAPLWGIGLVETVNKHTRFLHDGRARNLEEAILWHGGEAEASKQDYLKLSKQERQQVIKFLKSL